MRVIDLLNKIANGEEVPKKIKIFDTIFKYSKSNNFYFDKSAFSLSRYLDVNLSLNDEVEIIEEDKKIEKIKNKTNYTRNQKQIINKINEIIDIVIKLKDDRK